MLKLSQIQISSTFFYSTNKVDVVHCMTQNHGSQPFTLASHFRKHQFSCQHQSNYIPAHVLLLFMSLYKWNCPAEQEASMQVFWKQCGSCASHTSGDLLWLKVLKKIPHGPQGLNIKNTFVTKTHCKTSYKLILFVQKPQLDNHSL